MLVMGDPTQRSKQNLGPADQTPGPPRGRRASLGRSEAGPVEARQRPRGHQLRGGPGPAGAHPEGAGEALLPNQVGLGRAVGHGFKLKSFWASCLPFLIACYITSYAAWGKT